MSSARAQFSSRAAQSRSIERVLYFAPKACWPPNAGAKLRNYHLARQMARDARVTYLGFADDNSLAKECEIKRGNHRVGGAAGLDDFRRACEQVIAAPRERDYTLAKIIGGVVGRAPLPVLNYTSRAMARELARLLAENDFDLVQVEGIHLIAYLPIIRAARSRPLVVCDWHNVESELMRQYSERTPSAIRRFYARLTARRLAEIERRAMREFDAHIAVSEADRSRLFDISPGARVFVIENGVDTAYYSDDESKQSRLPNSIEGESQREPHNRVLFVGAMDYHANVDAALYFAREVWPRLREQAPGFTFTLLGRNPAPEVCALARLAGVEVTGTVEDVRPYYRQAIAAVVPLRIGGGSRLKILESMAAGVPVVSTRIGAEGLAVSDGENIILADGEQEICRALISLSEDREQRQSLAAAGRALVRARYDWSTLGAALLDAHQELAESRSQSREANESREGGKLREPARRAGNENGYKATSLLAATMGRNVAAPARRAESNRRIITDRFFERSQPR